MYMKYIGIYNSISQEKCLINLENLILGISGKNCDMCARGYMQYNPLSPVSLVGPFSFKLVLKGLERYSLSYIINIST